MTAKVNVGDRVRLVYTNDKYTKLRPGDLGTLKDITKTPVSFGNTTQLWINWDNGSKLALLEGIDSYEVVH